VKLYLQRLRPPRCEPRQQRSPASRASSKGVAALAAVIVALIAAVRLQTDVKDPASVAV